MTLPATRSVIYTRFIVINFANIPRTTYGRCTDNVLTYAEGLSLQQFHKFSIPAGNYFK